MPSCMGRICCQFGEVGQQQTTNSSKMQGTSSTSAFLRIWSRIGSAGRTRCADLIHRLHCCELVSMCRLACCAHANGAHARVQGTRPSAALLHITCRRTSSRSHLQACGIHGLAWICAGVSLIRLVAGTLPRERKQGHMKRLLHVCSLVFRRKRT